ncbi:MAG TPA: hypothetical protein ENF38_01485 [Candidatus Aenigmarchaeota archaeon]|nr:hypothetical protein [Candidatus Aenigmarchaeota archaeon]
MKLVFKEEEREKFEEIKEKILKSIKGACVSIEEEKLLVKTPDLERKAWSFFCPPATGVNVYVTHDKVLKTLEIKVRKMRDLI